MKMMVLEIRTITPTFMGGGDGRLDGIRIPEIKGMMRWWFRALAGGFVGDDFKKLKQIEGDLFGRVIDKENTQKSKFRLFVDNKTLKFITKGSSGIYSNGYTYLGIGNVIFRYDKRDKKFILNPEKANKAGNVLIDANSGFELNFSFYPRVNEDDINLIIGSFYLATALGGFGLRSRKGFGSWQIVGYDGLEDLLLFNPTDYTKNGINENITKLKDIFSRKLKNISGNGTGNPTPVTVYPAIDDSQFVFDVVETHETYYHKLLDQFGRLYRGFRVCAESPKPGIPARDIHTTDFDFLEGSLSPKNCDVIKDFNTYKVRNALFGLNIVYPQLKKSLQLKRADELLRRASPICFSVKEVNSRLVLHIVLFKSQFMPDNAKVKYGEKEVKIENYSLIENKFIPYIKKELEGGKNG